MATHHHREALRQQRGRGPRARPAALRHLPRARNLPHRPLSGKGDGAEHSGAALCQQHLGTAVEPQLHRPHRNHGYRDAGGRATRSLLRFGRGPARHGAEPSAANHGLHRHGAARHLRARGHSRRNSQGVPFAAAALARRHRPPHPAGAICDRHRRRSKGTRLPRRTPCRPAIDHRDLRSPQALHRQLALGRRAHLHLHRQTAGREAVEGGHPLPQHTPAPSSRGSAAATRATSWSSPCNPTRASACASG